MQTFLRSSAIALSLSALMLAGTSVLAKDEFPADAIERDNAVLLGAKSHWQLDKGPNRCRLARTFGSKAEPHILLLSQDAPVGLVSVTFAGPEISRFSGTKRLYLGIEGNKPMALLDRFSVGDFEGYGTAIIPPPQYLGRGDIDSESEAPTRGPAGIDLEKASSAERIVLRRGSKVLSFETGTLRPALAAMNECTSQLLSSWGLNAEKHQDYKPPVWENQKAIVARIVKEYPSRAERRGEQGIFHMRMVVEIDGTISNCVLNAETRTEELASPACRMMENARFSPAIDANGDPMRSFFSTTISYVM